MVHPIILKYGWEDPFSDFYGKEAKGNIIAVTGVKGGSGRSFVSVCLAIALSESGVPVLIADCSTHSASAFSAIGKRKLSTKYPTLISAAMTTSIEDLAMIVKDFSQKEGHVILDLPPIRSPLHLLGLTLADQILFTTRSDNSFYMWQERTCDMVVMARNLACTANPHRTCGYCGAMRPVAELVALLEAHAPDWHAGMAALRLEARGCPGCLLAATRQTHAVHPGSETSWEAENREYKLFGFDYGYERAVWWLAHPRPVRPSAGPSLAEILAMILPMGNEDVQMATPGMQRLMKPGVFDQRDMTPGDEIISSKGCSNPASKSN